MLNYSVDNIDLSNKEDAIVATNIDIPYSTSLKTSYVYDSENKVYKRFVNGVEHENKIILNGSGKVYNVEIII